MALALEERFAAGGVLRASLAVARAVVLLQLQDEAQEDRLAMREAALTALSEGLAVLWPLAPDAELAGLQVRLGNAYRERLSGDRIANQECAIACYEAALTVYSHEAAPHGWAMTQTNLGAAYAHRLGGDRIANQERAIACYEAALTVYGREATPREWAATLTNLGNAYAERLSGDRGANQECAIAYYEAALTVYSRDATPYGWAATRTNLGNAYVERLGGDRGANQECAIACYEAALTAYSRDATPHDWARTHHNLGAAYRERLGGDRGANQARAIACYEAALTVYSRDATPHDWAKTQTNLGNAYRGRLGGGQGTNQERAITCYEAALTIYNRDTTPHDWAMTQNNLGIAFRERLGGDRSANQERAIACYEAALTIYNRDTTPHDWAMTQNNLGISFRERLGGDRSANQERAIACYGAALTIYNRDTTPHDWAMTQNNLGEAYREHLGGDRVANQERAIACYEAALTVYSREATPYDWAGTQNNLGIAYRQRLVGDHGANQECAIACYEAALTVYRREATPREWANTQNNLGIAYRERLAGDRGGNQEYAIVCFEAALQILRLVGPPNALAVLILIGGLHCERGRPVTARAIWQEAQALREELLRAGTSLASRGETARLSEGLSVRLARLEVALGAPAAAVETLERGRALALRSALALNDIWLASLAEHLRAPVVHARETLEALRQMPPAVTSGGAGDVAAVRQWEEQLATAEATLDAALAKAQQAYGFVPPQLLEAEALAALAPERGAVVVLAGEADGGLAFVLPRGCGEPGPEHVVMLPDATTAALRAVLIRYVNDVSRAIPVGAALADLRAPNAALEEVLQTLWQHVMAPVLAKATDLGVLAGGELVLMPQGDLALLPLHAAGPKADAADVVNGHPWGVIDDYVVSYAPSGAVLQTARQRLASLPAGHGGLFGLFNPMRGTEDALPQAESVEMPALAALFGPAARTYAGAEATVERLLALPPQPIDAAYVHFACHGSFAPEDPEYSGLQLADDQRLTVRAIVQQLRLSANRWVALSACETAMVDVQHLPDEFVGLPAAFLQAGASGVIATLWSVYDRPTARLMPRLYQMHLTDGLAPAAALREAVLWLRQQTDIDLGHSQISDDTFSFGEPSDNKPDLQSNPLDPTALSSVNLYSLPIVWAAYSYHGV